MPAAVLARAVGNTMLGALALAAVLVLGTGAGALQASAAHAAEGGLSFSEDGISWSATPPQSLFPAPLPPASPSPSSSPSLAGRPAPPAPALSGLLVPGASRTSTVWLRNDYGEPVSLSAEIIDVAASSEAARFFGIAVHDGTGDGLERTAFEHLGAAHTALAQRALAAGESMQIDVTVDLSQAANDRTMNQDIGFALRVKIAGTIEVTIPSEHGRGGDSGTGLSNTGSDGGIMLVAIVAGLAMGASGWLLMVTARRRRERA